ncbi:nickel transporter [Phyllobacterium phragmitis]|uniref:Nickel transporter n=1 Tax=Phyllobacterium phragmitis TaxID=2670329 RepID=A0A2S9ILR0_9HYPH|nr:HisA/HisF-related TIM barrel protein [Phyllobacterium phragmitis]PRD41473.1 nickel transporter [Phyllobacterium phragmitis]
MLIIPVLDIKDGLVVRARKGQRDSYRPIETPLSPSAEIGDVAAGLREIFPFPAYYVADLDGIEGWTTGAGVFDNLAPLRTHASVWLDAGFCEAGDLQAALALNGVVPVLGSESQSDMSLLQTFHGHPQLALSLDFRGDDFLGAPVILDEEALWPSRVIVMTLARIGAGDGPDFRRLEAVKKRAGDRVVIAAGGIRNARDLERLEEMGVAGALVATALHDGALTPETVAGFMARADISVV